MTDTTPGVTAWQAARNLAAWGQHERATTTDGTPTDQQIDHAMRIPAGTPADLKASLRAAYREGLADGFRAGWEAREAEIVTDEQIITAVDAYAEWDARGKETAT